MKTILLAAALTLGLTSLVAAVIRRPLYDVLRLVCGSDVGARFWTTFAAVLLVMGPLFLVFTAAGGAIMLALGLLPKMAALVEAVPQVVLGGAGLVMFGMVAATGARILGAVDFRNNRYNLFVVAISIGFGMIPLVAPKFFHAFPEALGPILHSGILLAAISAVALNLFFNGPGTIMPPKEEVVLPPPAGNAEAAHSHI